VSDHRERLAWARRHLDALDKSIDQFIEGKPYHMRAEENPEGGHQHYRAILEVRKEPPVRDWGMMAGDVIHGLRSALDNLAYALQVKHSGPPADPKKVLVQFIICDDAKDWSGQCYKIKAMSPDVRAEIERLQPYHRADPTKRHILSILRDLSNVDKHRRLLVVVAVAPNVGFTLFNQITALTGYSGPLVDGTVIALWKIDGPLPKPEMNMDYTMPLSIEFPDEWPAWRGNVTKVLEVAADHVENVIFPKLESFLR
jgi:hypothetical protein